MKSDFPVNFLGLGVGVAFAFTWAKPKILLVEVYNLLRQLDYYVWIFIIE